MKWTNQKPATSSPPKIPTLTKTSTTPGLAKPFLRGKLHSVVEMSHPGNPKGTRWSAYRDYGRFGAFPTATIKSGEAVTFNYRFLIAAGEMPAADVIQQSHNAYAGTSAATPKVTAQPAEGAGKKAAPPKNK